MVMSFIYIVSMNVVVVYNFGYYNGYMGTDICYGFLLMIYLKVFFKSKSCVKVKM